MGERNGLNAALDAGMAVQGQALPLINKAEVQAREARKEAAPAYPASEQNPLPQLQEKSLSGDRASIQQANRAQSVLSPSQAFAAHEQIGSPAAGRDLTALRTETEAEQAKLAKRIKQAENFRRGIEKNIARLEQELKGAHWYYLRFDREEVNQQLLQEKKLLEAQLKREQELKEQMERSQKLSARAAELEREACTLAAEGKKEAASAALAKAEESFGQALQAVGNKDFLNKEATQAAINANRQITEEQLKVISKVETAEKILGGVQYAALEVLGVNDYERSLQAFRQGRILSGLSYGALGLTAVLGGGALSITRHGTKVAAKAGAELLAKEVCKEAVEKVGVRAVQKLACETGEAVAKESLEQMGKVLPKYLVRKGGDKALAQVTRRGLKEIHKIIHGNMKHAVAGLEKQIPLAETLAAKLQWISSTKAKDLAARLVELGMDSKKAMKSAKAMQKCLKAGGGLEKAVIKGFEKGLEKELRTVLKQSVLEGFERTFYRGLDDLAKKFGLDEASHKLMQKVGKEAAEEGFEAGLKALVKKAVKEGFKKFKKTSSVPNSSLDLSGAQSEETAGAIKRAPEVEPLKATSMEAKTEALDGVQFKALSAPQQTQVLSVVEEISGRQVRRTYRLIGQERRLLSSEIIESVSQAAGQGKRNKAA